MTLSGHSVSPIYVAALAIRGLCVEPRQSGRLRAPALNQVAAGGDCRAHEVNEGPHAHRAAQVGFIDAMHLEDVLRFIQTDCANLVFKRNYFLFTSIMLTLQPILFFVLVVTAFISTYFRTLFGRPLT